MFRHKIYEKIFTLKETVQNELLDNIIHTNINSTSNLQTLKFIPHGLFVLLDRYKRML